MVNCHVASNGVQTKIRFHLKGSVAVLYKLVTCLYTRVIPRYVSHRYTVVGSH